MGTSLGAHAIAWLGGLVVAGIALAVIVFKAYRGGKRAEENRVLRDRLEAKQTSERIEDEVARTPAEKRREELSRWDI